MYSRCEDTPSCRQFTENCMFVYSPPKLPSPGPQVRPVNHDSAVQESPTWVMSLQVFDFNIKHSQCILKKAGPASDVAGAQPSVTWGPPVPLGGSPQASCLLAFLLEGGQQRAAAGHTVLVGWDQGVGADTDLQGEGEDPRSKSPHTPRSPGVSVTLGEGEPQGSLCLARHHAFQHRSHCQSCLSPSPHRFRQVSEPQPLPFH